MKPKYHMLLFYAKVFKAIACYEHPNFFKVVDYISNSQTIKSTIKNVIIKPCFDCLYAIRLFNEPSAILKYSFQDRLRAF